MAKKKKAVPLSLQDLITQPRQLAHLPMMNKVTGYRVLIAVLQRLQGLWRIAKMPENDKNGQLYMNFITDEFEVKRQTEGVFNEGDVVFKLHLSDIADDPHYEEARTALSSITHINCFVPDKKNPGNYITESLMKIYGRRENGRFVGTDFAVVIPRNIAENILDINLFGNYIRFVGYTAGRLRSSFSYPLYIYLSEEWRHHGEHFVIPIHDLRFRLGFVKDTEDPTREHRYATWSQFCQKVLDQAQKELNALAEKGAADFTFDYEGRLHGCLLPRMKRPDAVAFTIIPTEAGKNIKEENDYAANRAIAMKLMTEFFGLHINQARALLHRVTPVIMSAFLAQLQQWHDEFQSSLHTDVKNIAAWAYTAIDTFIRTEEAKYFTPAEEVKTTDVKVKDEKKKQPPITDWRGWRIGEGINSEEHAAFRSMLIDLKAHASRHTDDFNGLSTLIDNITLDAIHDGKRCISLKNDGTFLTPETVAWYWHSDDFDNIISAHFSNYAWTGRR